MSIKELSEVDVKVLDKLHYCHSNKLLKFSKYVKAYRRNKIKDNHMTHEAFRKSILRAMVLRDLKVHAICCGFEIYDNDYGIYEDLLNKFMSFIKDPVKIWFIVFMPRGTWKSVLIQSCALLWVYIVGVAVCGEAPTIPMIHGDEDKASMNLDLLKIYAKSQLFQYLFPQFLEVIIDNSSELKFSDETSKIKRKEPHFRTLSVNSDPEGEHYGFYGIDDWVTFKNTATVLMNNKNKSKFRALYSLEDHVQKPKYAMVGTRHWTDDMYSELMSESFKEYVVAFEMPAAKYTDLDREDNIFYFRQLPKSKLKRYEIAFSEEPHKFMSQYFNMPKDRNERMMLSGDLPEFAMPEDHQVEKRILLCDPAVSKRNQFSRLIMHIVYICYDRSIYVVETYSSVGTTPAEFRDNLINMAVAHRVEDVIIEDVAAQEYMKLDIFEAVQERIASGQMTHAQNFVVMGHKHRENKEQHYMSFLQPLFHRKQVYINPVCVELIKQIKRQSELNDEVDCLSFMIELRKQRGFDFTNNRIEEPETSPAKIYRNNLKKKSKYGILKSRWY